jgi:hypothetical protein
VFFDGVSEKITNYVGSGKVAREILFYCAGFFDTWQSQKTEVAEKQIKKPSVNEFLYDEKSSREERAFQTLAPDRTDEIVQNTLPLLIHLMDGKWTEVHQSRPKDFDMVLQGSSLKIGISLCNHENMTSLASRFKRLTHQIKTEDFDHIVLIRHPHLPISSGAKKARKYFETLKMHRTRIIYPYPETLAALDALQSLMADAKAGDLACGGKTINENSMTRWIKETMDGPVWDFLCDVISVTQPRKTDHSDLFMDLNELLQKEQVIKLDDSAIQLGADLDQLDDLIRKCSGQIGYLAGPPPVIFQFIPATAHMD